jgi:GT2 family glycosyltransferase
MFFKERPPRILIVAPHADRKNYSINKWLSMVKNLTYPKEFYSIFISDNSKTKANTRMLRRNGINADWVKPKSKSNIAYMAESHEMCRRRAIAGNRYDYMLHWETDIEAPPNIIELLLAHKKRIVSALYPIDFGEKSKLLVQFAEKMSKGTVMTASAEHGDLRFIDGKLKKVFASGLGCCLIKRSVLKKIKFRYEKGVQVHPDTVFAYDLFNLGIPIYADTSIILKHNNSEWITF